MELTDTWPPRWKGPNFKGDAPSQALTKHRKGVEADAKLAAAYRKVEERESGRCQVTGVELKASSRNPKQLREHHHLKGRNVKPEWVHDPIRIVLVSKWVHDFLTAKTLLAVGTDARTVKFKWNPNQVKDGRAPFRLRDEVRI